MATTDRRSPMAVATRDQIARDPATPFWLKDLLVAVQDKDPVDVLDGLEYLAASVRQELGYMRSGS